MAKRPDTLETLLLALELLRRIPRKNKGGFKYEVQHGLTRRETPRGVS